MNAVTKILRETKHIQTEVDSQKILESKAEVCFIGRSNVGKSSLINAICQKKNMAHASQIPGKTRTINVYEVIRGHWIVDLPGYGFAVGLRDDHTVLGKVIEGYFKSRKNLCMVFVIVDALAGPTKLDMEMFAWLKHHSFPFRVVVSKFDKIIIPNHDKRKKEIALQLGLQIKDILWVSSKKNFGLLELQNLIGQLFRMAPSPLISIEYKNYELR